MRIFDYLVASEADKNKWFDSFTITSGLRYFGGKAFIGKYLMNHICNMACRMYSKQDQASIFIDAFTGGGKIGLSIPEGWFDTIVMNDLNYGVYSFFKSCKENPTALVKLIEEIGEVYNEDMFRYFALNRSNGNQSGEQVDRAQEHIDDLQRQIEEAEQDNEEDLVKYLTSKLNFYEDNRYHINNTKVDSLVAGAMTFWVTQTTWNGDTEASTATYRYSIADNKNGQLSVGAEKEKIASTVKFAQKHVFQVHKMMIRKNIIIENLDYKELIKKYNGLSYRDQNNKTHPANEGLGKQTKLWYFDPPYHPATLSGGNMAPYEDTFTVELTREMTDILANKSKDKYGELKYFIKSDYDPKYTFKLFSEELETARKKLEMKKNSAVSNEESNKYKAIIKRLEKQVKKSEQAYSDFDVLEENIPESKNYKPDPAEQEYKKVEVGTFAKGGFGEDNVQTQGTEFIWFRG